MPSRVSSMRGPVTAVTLLSALVVALRGWLPDATGAAGSTPAERESGGPASLILVGMLAATALGVLAMAVDPPVAAPLDHHGAAGRTGSVAA